MFDWVWQSNYCCSNRSDFRTFHQLSLVFWSIVVLHTTQCANRCFSNIFETILFECLSRSQVQWKVLFPIFFFFHIGFFARFNSLLLKHVYLFIVLFELSLRHVTERVTTIRSKFRSTLGNKESVENNIISHFWFYLPSRKTISKQAFGNRMIDWQNFIMSSIMFDWVWQSNYCYLNWSDFRTFD